MKLFKKVLVGVAVATAFAVPAQAGVMGVADMTVQGLGFTSTPPGGFTIGNELRTGNASASYNGVSTSSNANGVGNVVVDAAGQCVGNCAGAATLYAGGLNNSATHIGLSPLYNFALGDMTISGAALGGPIQGLTRANAVAANPTNNGSANATIFNGGTVTGTFTVGQTFTSSLFLNVDAFLRTWIAPLMVGESASAGAGFGWNMLVNGADIASLEFRPGDLNQSFFRVTAGDTLFSTGGTATYVSDSRTYTAGTTYTFAINQSSNAAITNAIPEPASLALLGLGLVGLAVTRRRKSV